MSTDHVLQPLVAYLNQQFSQGTTLNADTPLMEGVIDSLGVYVLIDFIEKEFGARIDDEEIIVENFQDARRLADFIASKRGESAA